MNQPMLPALCRKDMACRKGAFIFKKPPSLENFFSTVEKVFSSLGKKFSSLGKNFSNHGGFS